MATRVDVGIGVVVAVVTLIAVSSVHSVAASSASASSSSSPPLVRVAVSLNGGGASPSAYVAVDVDAPSSLEAFLVRVATHTAFRRPLMRSCSLRQVRGERVRCDEHALRVFDRDRRPLTTLADVVSYARTHQLHAGVADDSADTNTNHIENSNNQDGDNNEHAVSADERHHVFVIADRESFVWPPVELGYRRELTRGDVLSDAGGAAERGEPSLVLETVSVSPRVFAIEHFLSDAEMDTIRSAGEPQLKRSTLAKSAFVDNRRVSDTAWVRWSMLPPGFAPRVRAAELTNTSLAQQESLQLLHYPSGGVYMSHCDFFADSACDTRTAHAHNRLATVLFYLNDVADDAGGCTCFPRGRTADDSPDENVMRRRAGEDCSRGPRVCPRRGRAALFYNLEPVGAAHALPIGDRLSEHAACRLADGAEKWATNFWIWNVEDPQRGNRFPPRHLVRRGYGAPLDGRYELDDAVPDARSLEVHEAQNNGDASVSPQARRPASTSRDEL